MAKRDQRMRTVNQAVGEPNGSAVVVRRRGSIVARGPNTWLVRVFVGRNPATGKRKYRHATVRGTEAQADQRLVELELEVDRSRGRSTAPVVLPARRRWLAAVVRRAQPALGPLLASAAGVAAPIGLLPVAAAAGVVGAALAVWQEAQIERFLEAFEERMVGYVGQVADEKWAEGLPEDAVDALLQAMARAHLITGEQKLAAVAALVAGGCVAGPRAGITRTDLLEVLMQLNEGDIALFGAMWRLAQRRGGPNPHRSRISGGDLQQWYADREQLADMDAIRARVLRLQAAGLVYEEQGVRGTEWEEGEPWSAGFTSLAAQLVALAEKGGWQLAEDAEGGGGQENRTEPAGSPGPDGEPSRA